MENITKDILAHIIKDYYAKGMSYSETINIIEHTFLLSKENRIWCEDVWEGCVNAGEAE